MWSSSLQQHTCKCACACACTQVHLMAQCRHSLCEIFQYLFKKYVKGMGKSLPNNTFIGFTTTSWSMCWNLYLCMPTLTKVNLLEPNLQLNWTQIWSQAFYRVPEQLATPGIKPGQWLQHLPQGHCHDHLVSPQAFSLLFGSFYHSPWWMTEGVPFARGKKKEIMK